MASRVRGVLASVAVGIGALLSGPATAAGTSYPLTLTSGSRLMVDARINGHPVQALLDSAAEITLIDRKAAASFQVTDGTEDGGLGGELQRQVVTLPTLDIAGQRLTDLPVAID